MAVYDLNEKKGSILKLSWQTAFFHRDNTEDATRMHLQKSECAPTNRSIREHASWLETARPPCK